MQLAIMIVNLPGEDEENKRDQDEQVKRGVYAMARRTEERPIIPADIAIISTSTSTHQVLLL